MKGRAERRHKDRAKKQKYKKILEAQLPEPTARQIGKFYKTHGAECSCQMCRNPRHSNLEGDGRTQQEKKSDIDFMEELNET